MKVAGEISGSEKIIKKRSLALRKAIDLLKNFNLQSSQEFYLLLKDNSPAGRSYH